MMIYVHIGRMEYSCVSECEECRGVDWFNSVEEDIAHIMRNEEEDHDDEKKNLFDNFFF